MRHSTDPITAVVNHVEAAGKTAAGRRAVADWSASVALLAGWSTGGEIAEACRTARGADQDELVAALLGVGARDQLADLTVVSGLAGQLRRIVVAWSHSGAPRWELADLATELVSQCWAATSALSAQVADGRSLPSRVALHLVDEAREAVRVPRRRELRARSRVVDLPAADLVPASGLGRPVLEQVALEITAAVQTGRISAAAVRPVWLTRIAGFDVEETARIVGCTPDVIRATRSRAERRLVAA